MKVSNKILAGFFLFCALVIAFAIALPQENYQLSEVNLNFVGEKKNQYIFDKIRNSVEPYTASLVGDYVWNVSLNEIVKKISADKRVAEVAIRRRLPNKLELTILPHKPKALLVTGSRGQSLYPLANDGSLMPKISLADSEDLPLLRGQSFKSNKKLRLQALQLLGELPAESLLSSPKVSEVLFNKSKGFSLILNSQAGKIHMGKSDFHAKAIMVDRVLNYLNKEELQGRVIDARFSKKVVVRLRNAP